MCIKRERERLSSFALHHFIDDREDPVLLMAQPSAHTHITALVISFYVVVAISIRVLSLNANALSHRLSVCVCRNKRRTKKTLQVSICARVFIFSSLAVPITLFSYYSFSSTRDLKLLGENER